MAKMTEPQKQAYKAYRSECRISNVEPNRADFLAGDIPAGVSYQLALQNEGRRTELAAQSREWLAQAAAVGR